MNILVLFSYGSLTTLDDVSAFYQDIYHGKATDEVINKATKNYESLGVPDSLGANTKRIGRALIKRLAVETGETWEVFIANHHSRPSIETIAEQCAKLNPKKVATFGLTPFHSVTGNVAYAKKFSRIFRTTNESTELVHIKPFCENEAFIRVMIDRAKTAYNWLPEKMREDTEIIFVAHSMPGLPKVHEKMIKQYQTLARKIAAGVGIEAYHIAYRSRNPKHRWLGPDVLDVINQLNARKVPAVIFIEVLSVVENLEAIQEVTRDAVDKAREYGIKAVQTEFLNDSTDFVEALGDHIWECLSPEIQA